MAFADDEAEGQRRHKDRRRLTPKVEVHLQKGSRPPPRPPNHVERMRPARIVVVLSLAVELAEESAQKVKPVERDGRHAKEEHRAELAPNRWLIPGVDGEKGKRPGEGEEHAFWTEIGEAKGRAQKDEGGHRDAMQDRADHRDSRLGAGGWNLL